MLEKYPELFEIINTKILNFLSYKSRTIKEVSQKLDTYLKFEHKLTLTEKNFFKDYFLTHLQDLNLLNDAKYAKDFVKEKINSPKPISKVKIKQFLYKKGVAREVIDASLQNFSNTFEKSNAQKDAEKKMRLLKNKDEHYVAQKVQAYLVSKGYPFEIVRSIVDSLSDVK